jgi:hypothetical protein
MEFLQEKNEEGRKAGIETFYFSIGCRTPIFSWVANEKLNHRSTEITERNKVLAIRNLRRSGFVLCVLCASVVQNSFFRRCSKMVQWKNQGTLIEANPN